jgi:hypothetical protein
MDSARSSALSHTIEIGGFLPLRMNAFCVPHRRAEDLQEDQLKHLKMRCLPIAVDRPVDYLQWPWWNPLGS